MQQKTNNNLFIKRLTKSVLNNWYWFLLSLSISVALVWFYHESSTFKYKVQGVLMFKDSENSVTYADLIFGRNGSMQTRNVNNETILLKSAGFVIPAISALNFDVSYFKAEKFKNVELYGDLPFEVEVDLMKSENPAKGKLIGLEATNKKGVFKLIFSDDYVISGEQDRWLDVRGYHLKISIKESFEPGQRYFFKVNGFLDLAREYMAKINVVPLISNSSMMEVSVVGENPDKEKAFLEMYLKQVEEISLSSKNFNYQKAISFINDQLNISIDTLSSIESRLLSFKGKNNTVDIGAETTQLYSHIQALEQQKAQITVSNKYYDYLIRILNNSKNLDEIVIPTSVGVNDPILGQLISQLISAQIEIKSLVVENKMKNPLVQEKQEVIAELKSNILTTVENLKGANQITLDDIENRLGVYHQELQRMPEAEQELVGIQRNYSLNESLYMLLMEKKLESGIKMAANESDYRTVNAPSVIGRVSPNVKYNYLIGVAAGLGIPLAILYLLLINNNKLITKEDLKNVMPFSIIGNIPRYNYRKGEGILIDPVSPTAESFRGLRSNLQYLQNPDTKCNLISITSAISGEGKTFCSQNLAYILALAKQKVLLINCDMRKPASNQEYLREGIGLSEYLAGIATFQEVISTTKLPNLSIINAGKEPPNPSELLINTRMESLLLDLKQDEFDYVILDTPPAGLFADALDLGRLVDILLLITKQQTTPLLALKRLNEVLKERPFKKVAIIYNGLLGYESPYAAKKYYNSYYKKKKENSWKLKIKS